LLCAGLRDKNHRILEKEKIRKAAMDKIDQIIDKHHGEASSLLQILLDIQSENNWLPKEALGRIIKTL